ncbi:MAG: molybdopterin-dependent oxidoreductase, partial [Desulfobacterales bacterium]|nr:molybdopterin-dependent oxidoreductase [Desulfobacterales bacterium]
MGATELGQGSQSEMSQIAAEVLGVRYEDVSVVHSDTATTPYDQSQVASRTTVTTGNAVKAACEDLRRQLFEEAATMLEAIPEDLKARDGWIYAAKDPEKRLAISEVAKIFLLGRPPKVVAKGVLIGRGSYTTPSTPPPVANTLVNIVEVEVDTTTGHVEISRLVSAVDCGKAINPMGIEAQYDSVLSGGVGFALSEELVMDPSTGRLLNPTFLDYKTPSAADAYRMDPVILVELPARHGPFGAKGVGEAAMAAAAPAISNAIYNALGIRVDLPATPQKVIMAMDNQGKGA